MFWSVGLLDVGLALFMISCGYNVLGTVIQTYREGDVRLADGPHPLHGRLEIYHEDAWGTVCSNNWDDNDAQVVCRQLGFVDGVLIENLQNKYPTTSSSVLLTDVACDGTESSLTDCTLSEWDSNSCTHSQDVNVLCKVPSYKGCFISQYPNYALTGKQVVLSVPMTVEKCMSSCGGFELIGLEGGDTCFCGRITEDYSQYGEVTASECITGCNGDSAQYCGGAGRLLVYERGCSESSNPSSGIIVSPMFPGNYGQDEDCWFQIDLSMNIQTDVTFHLFDVTGSDTLTLSNENGFTISYSSSNLPQYLTEIDSEILNVRFVSSATSIGGQYVITYIGVLKCPTSYSFSDGTLLMEGHEFYYENDMAVVICNDGFEPVTEEIVCTAEGEWSPTPSCRASSTACVSDYTFPNGTLIVDGNEAMVICDEGFESFSEEVLCTADGVWSPTPYCGNASTSDIPDDDEEDTFDFQPILIICLVILSILGIMFLTVICAMMCTNETSTPSDKRPLENTDTPAPSELEDDYDYNEPSDGPDNVNTSVPIEEADATEEGFMSNIY